MLSVTRIRAAFIATRNRVHHDHHQAITALRSRGAALSGAAVLLGVTVAQSGSNTAALTTTPSSTVISLRNTADGRTLVDAQGRSLYLFEKDSGTQITCTGSCASYWPPVPASGTPKASAGTSATTLGSLPGQGGTRQLTYGGHRLYYFVGDTKAGQVRGAGVDEFGAKWYPLDSTGAAVTRAPASTGRGGSGYGSGY